MFHLSYLNSFSPIALRCRNIAAALLVLMLLGANTAVAIEWIKETPYFLIRRDYQRFKIPASAVVFFKTKTAWGTEKPDAEIRGETRRLLGTRLRFIDNSADAQYGLSVRLEEYTDYATRNSRGRPATGFIMLATCKLPLVEVTESCQNLMFYYFGRESRLEMFRRAAEAWFDLVIE